MNSLLIFVIFNILEDFILNEICEKEKPILKGDQCQNIFCPEIEYINGVCQVSNSIIKTQWLSNIFFNYNEKNVDSFSLIKLKSNDIITIAFDSYDRKIIYQDKYSTSDYNPFKIDNWKQINGSYPFNILNGVLLNINNIEYPLICDVSSCELIDIENEEHYFKSLTDMCEMEPTSGRNFYSYYFKIINLNNENKILFNFIFNDIIKLCIVNIQTKELDFQTEKIVEGDNIVNSDHLEKLSCFTTKKGYIECLYSLTIDNIIQVRVVIYNSNLDLLKILTIDSQQYTETDYYYTNFNDCILLKEEIGLYTYYLIPTGISQPQLYLQINELINDGTDFVFNKFETTEKIEIIFDEEAILNENHFYYTQTGYLMKINDNKFSYIFPFSDGLYTTDSQKYIVLAVFEVFNNKNLISRYYKINFNLYGIDINTVISLNSFMLNSNIGVSFIPSFLNEERTNVGLKQISVIFGFIQYEEDNKNITLNLYQNYKFKIDKYLYFNITNNLFGYQLKYKLVSIDDSLGNMKIISLNYNKEININDLIDGNETLLFHFDNITDIKIENDYFLEMAVLAYEPEYEDSLLFCDKHESIGGEDPKNYYERKIIQEKTYKIKLKFSCYETCQTCEFVGFNDDYQKCLSCKQNENNDFCYMESKKNCYNTKDSIYSYYISSNNKICIIINESEASEDIPFTNQLTQKSKIIVPSYSEEPINKLFDHMHDLIKSGFLENQTNNEILLFGNNISAEVTISSNQKFYLENGIINNRSIIDLSEIEKKLGYNKSLIIIKVDIFRNDSVVPQVEYILIDPYTYDKINASLYKGTKIDIFVPFDIPEDNYNLYKFAENQGYNIFDQNDSFYNDICTPFDSQNKTDVLINSRKKDFFRDFNFCEEGCKYDKINTNVNKVKCICEIKEEVKTDNSFSSHKLLDKFYDLQSYTNIRIIICYNLVFNEKIFTKNIGNYILLSLNVAFIALTIINIYTNSSKISEILINIIKQKENILNLYNINQNNTINGIEQDHQEKLEELGMVKKKKKKKKKKRKKSKSKTAKSEIKIEQNQDQKSHPNPPKNKKNIKSTPIIIKEDLTKETINKQYSSNTKDIIINQINFEKEKSIIPSNNENKENKYYELIIKNFEFSERKKFFNIEELNSLSYEMAIEIDDRNYFQYYWSLLKLKQLMIFTFITNDDYNVFLLKLGLFIISFSLYFTINALFFTDDSIDNLYKEKGKYNFIYQIPQILYSSIISSITNLILKKLSLSQKDILSVKQILEIKQAEIQCKKVKRCLKIKSMIFMIIGILLLSFFWYYLSCFCSVFVNTQISLLKDTIISYGLSMIYPFGLNLIPGFFRIPAIKGRNKICLYRISKFLAII